MSDKERWYRRLRNFLKETRAELKKVTWPSRNEITNTTVVVIISVFFFGFYLFAMDIVFSWLITQVKALLK